MFHSSPPLDLPIRVHQSNGAIPVTRVFENQINIQITAHGMFYGQFAFQLGHELGHVMPDPRRTNGVVEAICIAVSYEVLDRIGRKLKDSLAGVETKGPTVRAGLWRTAKSSKCSKLGLNVTPA